MANRSTHPLRAPTITCLVVGIIFVCVVAALIMAVGLFFLDTLDPDDSLQFENEVGNNIRSFVEASPITGGDVSILVDLPDLDTQVFKIYACGFLCESTTTYYGMTHGNKTGFLVDYIYDGSSEYKHLILYDFDDTDTDLYTDEFITESINQKGKVSRYDDYLLYSLAKDADTPRTVLYNIASSYYDGSTTDAVDLQNEMALVLIHNPTVRNDKEILALIATQGGQAGNNKPDAQILALELLDFQLPEEDLIILRDTFRMEGVQALQDALIARQVDLIGNDHESNYPIGEDLEAALVPEYLEALPIHPMTGEQPHYAWYLKDNPQGMKMQVWTELETYQPELGSTSRGVKANLDTTQPGWAGDTVDARVTNCTPAPNDCIYDLSSLSAFMDEL